MSKRTTLLNILNQLHKPLSTINDRWRKRIELLLNFTVQYAVELRGPTEDEIGKSIQSDAVPRSL